MRLLRFATARQLTQKEIAKARAAESRDPHEESALDDLSSKRYYLDAKTGDLVVHVCLSLCLESSRYCPGRLSRHTVYDFALSY